MIESSKKNVKETEKLEFRVFNKTIETISISYGIFL